ncbi:thermonuclease family protein [Halovenus rubra]|uniref:Thermonuclease family protein n=2 Tax=Halovenus rubra TaxID=869890 RepID=A0ABD5X0N5_9EURY|nr:DUF4350 domain-containing protein [Halovenus rubra]
MKRRTLIIGLGATAGAGTLLGSGAFSTASAERQISVQVADDANAFVSLTPGDENGEYTDTSGDALVISISDGDIGAGVDTEYTFDGIVEIGNQGTDSKYIWTGVSSAAFDDDSLYMYADDPNTPLSDAAAVELAAGESVSVGLYLDTTGLESGDYSPTLTVEAADEDPDAPGGSPGDPTDPPEETIPSVVLDSVASLLDENEQPLTDDGPVAIWAESTAENADEDGNGDAVDYPSDTDIPVAAVDGSVLGVTGPFITTSTDFGSYGNEEFMLNAYDQLLDGSGTILHDEGHGQFYTLSPNGGDDFQAFADYVGDNGYTYEATTDIENDLANADGLTITSPTEAFTDSELTALADFVDNGGAVFLHDQADYNNFDETVNHNEIAEAIGASFRFNDDQVTDSENNDGVPFVPTTTNFNETGFPDFFPNRDGLGLELDPSKSYEVDVVDVTDGDTANVQFSEGTVETVRIVGIDTPETGSTDERLQEYEGIDDGPALKDKADDAAAYAGDQLADETVTLSFDENEPLRGNFGRLLGFLELSDGSVYNESVIEDGWARVYDSGLGTHDEYLDLEATARDADDGIWEISDPASTPAVGDDPVNSLFFPEPVEVTGPDVPVKSESGEALVALDTDANVAVVGGPFIEENFESGEGGPGIDSFGVYPFLTNVLDTLGDGVGPVLIDGGHGQFGADYAVSAEDAAYYLRYLEGQLSTANTAIGFEGVNDVTSDAGPQLLEDGEPAASALILSTPVTELTADERTAIADYAAVGGSVILLGTSADVDALGNFDSLLSDLGAAVGFTTNAVTDESNNLAGDPTVPTTSNFEESSYPDLFTPFSEN